MKLLALGRLVLQAGWADDGVWTVTNPKGQVHAFHLGLATVTAPAGYRCWCVLVGPLQVTAGWVTP
jgi:hypothetical protein